MLRHKTEPHLPLGRLSLNSQTNFFHGMVAGGKPLAIPLPHHPCLDLLSAAAFLPLASLRRDPSALGRAARRLKAEKGVKN